MQWSDDQKWYRAQVKDFNSRTGEVCDVHREISSARSLATTHTTPQYLLRYEEDESEELVDLDKLTEGKDWIREERKFRRKNNAKQSKHTANLMDEELKRARDMSGRELEVFGAGKWRGAVVKSFSAETKQVFLRNE